MYKKGIKFLVLCFLYFNIQSFGQIVKFKTTSISIASKNKNSSWEKFTLPKPVVNIVSLDNEKARMIIYSEVIQVFDIIKYFDVEITPKNDTASFAAKDQDGDGCIVSIITRKNQGNRQQLYIKYQDRIVLFNVELVK
jgi:hypothetical protein